MSEVPDVLLRKIWDGFEGWVSFNDTPVEPPGTTSPYVPTEWELSNYLVMDGGVELSSEDAKLLRGILSPTASAE